MPTWSSIVPCTFYGIDCFFNTIHGIDLHNNNLKGTIPKRLFELPHLSILDVSRNAVTMTYKAFQELGKEGSRDGIEYCTHTASKISMVLDLVNRYKFSILVVLISFRFRKNYLT